MKAADLMVLPRALPPQEPCVACAALVCPGWESLPGSYLRSGLQCVGTLRVADEEDPTVIEYHPNGTNSWSLNAPIAPGYFPYNRCDVWRCVSCHRPFLRYTEYGGYYSDERIRQLDATLVTAADPSGQ